MNLFYKKTSDNKGFTLIEIIAVLIILGIMAAVAVSRMGSNQSDLIPQVDIIKSHLRFAQLKALADDINDDGTAVSWRIVFTTNYYTLYKNNTAAAINLLGEDGNRHTFQNGVTFTTATPTATIAFDRWGSPVDSTDATLPPLAVDATVTLSQGGTTSTINIAKNTGYITP